MADIVSPAVRSRMMAGIGGKNTRPELVVRRALFASGYRFRLHRRDLPGAPDIVLPGRRIAIFVHGCFWHRHPGCRFATTPATRPDFWKEKFEKNVIRDSDARDALRLAGWRVLTCWECATKDREFAATLGDRLRDWIESGEEVGEIGPFEDGARTR